MGRMRHHAIVVTCWDETELIAARAAALTAGCAVTLIGPPTTNGYVSFLVVPDGSKEGWPESDRGDTARDTFVAWIRAHTYGDGSNRYDWAEVQYGDDDLESRLLRSGDDDESALLRGPGA